MQCLGRTTTGKRCRKEARLFCMHHKWQPWLFFVSCVSFLAIIAGLYQDLWKPFVNHDIIIPSIHGESYPIARALLIREGWIPQANHWLYGNSVEVQRGNGSEIWEKGYHELDYCSSTGYALCRFEFNNPSGDLLVVITSGEIWEGDFSRLKVFKYYLNPENEEGAYVDILSPDKRPVEERRKEIMDVLKKMDIFPQQ